MARVVAPPQPQRCLTHETGNEATLSVKHHLMSCKNTNDILAVVKHLLASQLRYVLQTTSSDEDLMAARSSDMGFDSLISVNLCSWIQKKFEISVDVRNIMDDTMADVATLVVQQMPKTLLGA